MILLVGSAPELNNQRKHIIRIAQKVQKSESIQF